MNEQVDFDKLFRAGKTERRAARQYSTQTWIADARAIHGDKFDYTRVRYVNRDTHVEIGCPIHGFSFQHPKSHLQSSGCRKCGFAAMKPRKSKEHFINDARAVHGDRYDYTQVAYKNQHTPVVIVCREHGQFQQMPKTHLRGANCPVCANIIVKTTHLLPESEFINRARARYGDRFDYSQMNYINFTTAVRILCREHGPFTQNPRNHVEGHVGCRKCHSLGQSTRMRERKGDLILGDLTFDDLTAEFVAAATAKHGERFDYSLTRYRTQRAKVTIICREHGPFRQRPDIHLNGHGCRKCVGREPHNTESFILAARARHGDRYDYSLTEFVIDRKVTIICREHGQFQQKAHGHLRGAGCRKCAGSFPYTTDTFVAAARARHGDRYDYSGTECSGSRQLVRIGCREHGPFWMRAATHLQGRGCQSCARTGFDPKKPARFYVAVVRDNSEREGVKIGITNQVDDWFLGRYRRADMRENMEPHSSVYFADGAEALRLETAVIRGLDFFKLDGASGIGTSGSNETLWLTPAMIHRLLKEYGSFAWEPYVLTRPKRVKPERTAEQITTMRAKMIATRRATDEFKAFLS